MYLASISLLFLFQIFYTEGTDNTPSCGEPSSGYVYASQSGHCYKFHSQGENWTTAQWICAGENARLAVINNNLEAKVLIDLYNQHTLEEMSGVTRGDYIPIGIYYEAGGWRTVDGQTINQAGYAKWESSRPTENVTFPYAFMNRHGMLNNGAFDANKLSFICEKAPVSLCW